MGKRLALLDLFCKGGGSAMGYHLAGFDVVGIDIKHQKRYPFEFIQLDVNEILNDDKFLNSFDVLTASPPCQTHSRTQHLRDAQGRSTIKLDMIPQVREAFIKSGKPYVIENVEGAPLRNPLTLCGSSFGLGVRRHRLFESNIPLTGLPCDHKSQGRPIGVYGSLKDNIPNGGRTATTVEEARQAMGIDWMIWNELKEAIPPAYTKFIGEQIHENINKVSRQT